MPPLTLLYTQLGEELLAFIRGRVQCPDDADDLFQEMWVRLLSRPPREGNTRAWLYRVVRNLITDYNRRKPLDAQQAPTWEVEVSETEAQVASWLRIMIEDLPPKYGQALLKADLEGKKMREVAEEMGLSQAATRSRVQRARKMLNESLHDCCHFWFDKNGKVEGWEQKYPKPASNCTKECS